VSVPAKPNAKVSAAGGLRFVPRTVIALGFVSLCMDTSWEIIHSLLPAFLVTVLGANGLSIGIIEGVAEATTAMSRVFSGALSDWLGKRKLLVLIGYGLAAVTKPLFPLATRNGSRRGYGRGAASAGSHTRVVPSSSHSRVPNAGPVPQPATWLTASEEPCSDGLVGGGSRIRNVDPS